MRTLHIGLVILAIASRAVAAEPFAFDETGTLASGTTYRLTVREAPYKRQAHEKPDDGSRWGIDGGYPASYVEEFRLTLGKRKVFVPRKFFNDMSHLSRVSIEEQKGSLLVAVTGGDAAGSFTAEFRFRGGRFLERIVRHGEFPNERWERTIFRSHPL